MSHAPNNTHRVEVILEAGCSVATQTRVMQIAGFLHLEGFTPVYYYRLSDQTETSMTLEHTIDAKISRPWFFPAGEGTPIILSVHKSMDDPTSPETIILTDALSGEVVGGNDECIVPPIINEYDPKQTAAINQFFGRNVFVAVSTRQRKDHTNTRRRKAESSKTVNRQRIVREPAQAPTTNKEFAVMAKRDKVRHSKLILNIP